MHSGVRATVWLAALALPTLPVGGCVQPHSGVRAALWCQPADGASTVIDDMEDGDGKLCPATTGWPGGTWQVVLVPGTPAATVSLPVGPLPETDPQTGVTLPVALADSTRGIHLTGTGFTSASNASVVLAANFAAPLDLAGTFSSVQFWALADRDTWMRVNFATAIDPATGARWGQPVRLGPAWTQVIVPLAGLSMEFGAAAAADLTATSAIELKYAYFVSGASGANIDPGNAGAFNIWIDDIQLTP